MRRSGLRVLPPPDRTGEPGYREWHAPIYGRCACCGAPGRLERHHVIHEQHVRRIDPDKAWDLRNSLELGAYCRCHRDHTSAAARLPASIIPAAALEFGIELMDAARVDQYVERYYSPR